MTSESVADPIAGIFDQESRRVLATLIRLLGDLDLAEEALQEAFCVALTVWPRDGIPENPRAWLGSTARFKGIDCIRRQERGRAQIRRMSQAIQPAAMEPEE